MSVTSLPLQISVSVALISGMYKLDFSFRTYIMVSLHPYGGRLARRVYTVKLTGLLIVMKDVVSPP